MDLWRKILRVSAAPAALALLSSTTTGCGEDSTVGSTQGAEGGAPAAYLRAARGTQIDPAALAAHVRIWASEAEQDPYVARLLASGERDEAEVERALVHSLQERLLDLDNGAIPSSILRARSDVEASAHALQERLDSEASDGARTSVDEVVAALEAKLSGESLVVFRESLELGGAYAGLATTEDGGPVGDPLSRAMELHKRGLEDLSTSVSDLCPGKLSCPERAGSPDKLPIASLAQELGGRFDGPPPCPERAESPFSEKKLRELIDRVESHALEILKQEEGQLGR